MKALFNATCSFCETLKPRCAKVFFKRVTGTNPPKRPANQKWLPEPDVICEDCRKGFPKGSFRYAPEHK